MPAARDEFDAFTALGLAGDLADDCSGGSLDWAGIDWIDRRDAVHGSDGKAFAGNRSPAAIEGRFCRAQALQPSRTGCQWRDPADLNVVVDSIGGRFAGGGVEAGRLVGVLRSRVRVDACFGCLVVVDGRTGDGDGFLWATARGGCEGLGELSSGIVEESRLGEATRGLVLPHDGPLGVEVAQLDCRPLPGFGRTH